MFYSARHATECVTRHATECVTRHATECVTRHSRHTMLASWRCRQLSSASSSPLKIAYFGSDDFSVLSLQRLLAYQNQQPQKIGSIDVITRSKKRTGRNLKTLSDVPIGKYAEHNAVSIHRADTASDVLQLGESMHFDLAVAVSYGKLIPAQFISSLTFGGLNVHPSLLPKYSGSSPLQYALLNDDPHTGVTVQTLHPTKFDKGDIIIQSPPVPISSNDNYTSLAHRLGNIGADLLVKTIDEGLFIPPLSPQTSSESFSSAPKILPSTSEIQWSKLSSRRIKRLNDALGSVHTYIPKFDKQGNFVENLKCMLSDFEIANVASSPNLNIPGEFALENDKLFVKTLDGCLAVSKLKLQYCAEESASEFMARMPKRLRKSKEINQNPHQFQNADWAA